MMVVLLPTLNRIELLRRFFESYKTTNADCAGYVLVDEKDYQANLSEYEKIKNHLPGDWIFRNTKEAVSMGDKVRFVWQEIKHFKAVGLLNDDHFCVTNEWDKKVENLLDGTNMVSTNDGNWNFGMRVCGLTAWSMPLLEASGFPIFPRNLQHLCIDDVWKNIGDATGCWLETMKVNIEHRHAFKNEMSQDSTFQKVYAPPSWEYDSREYKHFMEQDFKEVCERIIALRSKEIAKEKFT